MSNTDLILPWVADLEKVEGRAPSTVSKYYTHVTRFLDWLEKLEVVPLEAPAEMIRAYVGPELHTAGLAPRSRRQHISAIKSFYRYYSSIDKCLVSPAADVKAPYAGRPLPTVMTQNTLASLLMACDLSTFKGLRDAALIGLLAETGARATTLCELNQSSLLWEQTGDSELLTVRLIGKGSVEHLAPVGDEGRLMLRAYMGHRSWLDDSLLLENGDRPLLVNLGSSVPGSDRQGERRRLTRKGAWYALQRVGDAAGVGSSECHPHAFRHMVGTAVYETTGDLKAVQEHLGHLALSSAEIYTHLALKRKRAIAAKSGVLKDLDNVWSNLARSEREART